VVVMLVADNRGHTESESLWVDEVWLSFSEDSARDLVRLLCCFAVSCRDRRSVACCCNAAERKALADATESERLLIGLHRLDMILSIS
jgi:hypothetical protein